MVELTLPLKVEAEGDQTLEYRSRDVAGNEERVRQGHFRLDLTPPQITVTQPAYAAYYQGVTLTVAYTATEAQSGLGELEARLDGETVASGVELAAFSLEPGWHTVVVTATNGAGLVGRRQHNFEVLRLPDYQPPETTCTLTGELGIAGWYVSPVTVTLAATDNWSGVERTEYRLTEEDWQTYTAPLVVGATGWYRIAFRSRDRCGNEEEAREVEFQIAARRLYLPLILKQVGRGWWPGEEGDAP